MQEDIVVENGKITGTLKFIEDGLSPSGPLSGDGYFIALKFTPDENATSTSVGLQPSMGTGMVELDEDLNAVFKIDNVNQKLIVKSVDSTHTYGDVTDIYDLSELVLEEIGA